MRGCFMDINYYLMDGTLVGRKVTSVVNAGIFIWSIHCYDTRLWPTGLIEGKPADIKDEYGKVYGYYQFIDMIHSECPTENFDSI